jgi:hypothetical protein
VNWAKEFTMSESNPIRLYAVHGWHQDEDYARLFEYLESADNFFYRALSDPAAQSPQGDGTAARRTLISEALKHAECVVCPAGTWDRFNDWARFTVESARSLDIPVVAIEHFGPKNMDVRLKGHAAEVVGWDSRSIVDAIRREARHEDTTRFDLIEFDL